MKGKRKTVLSLVICLALFSLVGCGGNEDVKNTISLIDAIGDVTIESKAAIDSAYEAYNALDEKEKESVTNIEKLYAAQEAFEACVPDYVDKVVSDFRFSDDIDQNELKEFVDNYFDYLNDEQIETIGCVIGKCNLQDLTIPLIKESMKNPDSFELISFDPGVVIRRSGNTYFSMITIKYRGTNSFGGVVPESTMGTVDFEVNFDDCTIEYLSHSFM